jgi:hypothetical protein
VVPADIRDVGARNQRRSWRFILPATELGQSLSGTYSSPTLTLAATTSGHSNTDRYADCLRGDGASDVARSLHRVLPLPSGAATAARQRSAIIGHVDGIEGSLSNI